MTDAFASLPAEDQQVLQLRFLGELSFEEIAQTMKISLSAAKMRIYRAAERFRAQYETLTDDRKHV